jgi:hypothetical protein
VNKITRGGFWIVTGHNGAPYNQEEIQLLEKKFITVAEYKGYDCWAKLYTKTGELITDFESSLPSIDGYIPMWGNSTIISKPINLKKGNYTFIIHGYSSKVMDEFAHIVVAVNGRTVGDLFLNEQSNRQQHSFSVETDQDVQFQLTFDNDTMIDGKDRNAFIKALDIHPALQ